MELTKVELFDPVVIQDWIPMKPKWFHRTVSGKIVYPFKQSYCRVVRKYQHAQYEIVIEWGDIFDVIRVS